MTHLIAFHAQQCIEKSLKAVLESNDAEVPKIHSLARLFHLASITFSDYDPDLIDRLDKLYIDARYPGEFGLLPNGKPTIEDARQFYEFAGQIYFQVRHELGS